MINSLRTGRRYLNSEVTNAELSPLSPLVQSDGAPVLVSSPRVWVPQGGMLQISRTVLRAELPGARHSRITYSIRGDPPRHGECLGSLWAQHRACFSPCVPQSPSAE